MDNNDMSLEELRRESQIRFQTLRNASKGVETSAALKRLVDTIGKIKDKFGADEENRVWQEYREQVAMIMQENAQNREGKGEPQGFTTVEELMDSLGRREGTKGQRKSYLM